MIKKCSHCGSNFEPDKWHPYQICCSKSCTQKRWRKKTGYESKRSFSFRNKRFELIDKLGGKCRACKIEDKYVLTFDHIYNDRNKEKNDYRFVKRCLKDIEKTKKRIQLLCWNHNALKQNYPETFNKRFLHLKSRPLNDIAR